MLDVKKLLTKILTAIKVDYIVEESTSGDWTYRKWNSGIAECWGVHTVNYTSMSTWGSWYYSQPYKTINFPTNLFNTAPSTSVTRYGGVEGVVANTSVSATAVVSAYLIRPTSTGSNYFTVSIHAIGKWK